ncbi:TPA: hypothetical protein ACNR7M_002157 [Escherichia coli]
MERITETLSIACADEIPDIALLRQTSREKVLHLHFASEAERYREEFGLVLKAQLDEFVVGMHSADPVIRIARLISLEEINRHQDFFEHCAKEYRKLATELIFALAEQLNVEMAENNPLPPSNATVSEKAKWESGSIVFTVFIVHLRIKKQSKILKFPSPTALISAIWTRIFFPDLSNRPPPGSLCQWLFTMITTTVAGSFNNCWRWESYKKSLHRSHNTRGLLR